jgi:hypothetical protein
MIDPNKKAQALAGLAAGKKVREVAKETGLSVGTVGHLRSTIPEQIERIRTEDKNALGALIAQHFQQQTAALNAYANHTSTPEYVRANTASDMAALYGTVSGHVVRILDIAARVGGAGRPAERTGSEETVS